MDPNQQETSATFDKLGGASARWRSRLRLAITLAALMPAAIFPPFAGAQESQVPVSIDAAYAQMFRAPDGEHVVILEGAVVLRWGTHIVTADRAVTWMRRTTTEAGRTIYQVTAYLRGNARVLGGAAVLETATEDSPGRLLRLGPTEQVLLTAATRVERPGHEQPFYQEATQERSRYLHRRDTAGPRRAEPPSAPPAPTAEVAPPGQPPAETPVEAVTPAAIAAAEEDDEDDDDELRPERLLDDAPALPPPAVPPPWQREMLEAVRPWEYPAQRTPPPLTVGPSPEPRWRGEPGAYEVPRAVHLLVGGHMSSRPYEDGDVFVCDGGVYLYQEPPAELDLPPGALLELRADKAVVFYDQQALLTSATDAGAVVYGVYLEGDVIMQVGHHTIGAERVYYDFVMEQGLILDAALRSRLGGSALPLHARAAQLRMHSLQSFSGERLQVSNDEFYLPGVWLGAAQGELAVETDPEGQQQFVYELEDVSVNIAETPVFVWPRAQGSTRDSSLPIKRVRTSYDSHFGLSVESQWALAWLLGFVEPRGVDSVLRADVFSKRGPAGGLDMDYEQPEFFGSLRTYMVHDRGDDKLGDFPARREVEPPHPLRGRARWQHRQFLPYDWEGTFEVSYLSDADYLESWSESEFDTDKGQETLVYFKNQRDHWAFDLLGKFRLNDFEYTLTEQPTAGFHVVGQDLFGRLTYHHNGYISRVREQAGKRDVPGFFGGYEPSVLGPQLDQQDHGLAVSRHELSWPLQFEALRVAPTVIGTFVWDDRASDSSFVQGAAGFRAATTVWRADRAVTSRFWDIDGLRHIVTPEANVFWVDSNQNGAANRDVYNLVLRQRWQTRRGPVDRQQVVDVLRWDIGATLVNRDVDNAMLPNKFFYGSPEPQFGKRPIMNADLANLGLAQREQLDQSVADHLTTDWEWQISQNTAFLGGMNLNMHDGALSQATGAVAVQRSPRTSYYVGYRFLRDGDPFDPRNAGRTFDSEWLTTAVSYRLNQHYTMGLGHQLDLTRRESAYTQAVLIRKLRRWYSAVSVAHDATDNSYSITFSIWPEGFDQFAIGTRRFTHLTE